MYRTNYDSPIGELTLASDGNNLIGLWMVGQKYYGSTVNSNLIDEPNLPIFIKTKEWLDRYFLELIHLFQIFHLSQMVESLDKVFGKCYVKYPMVE